MPYSIRKNPHQDTYKVVNKDTKRVYAYRTKDPVKLIQAIEINKRKSRTSGRASGRKNAKAAPRKSVKAAPRKSAKAAPRKSVKAKKSRRSA
jgi:hypothetical protein